MGRRSDGSATGRGQATHGHESDTVPGSRRDEIIARLARRCRSSTAPSLASPSASVDLTNFDVAAMVDSDLGRLAKTTVGVASGALRETTYVGVGFHGARHPADAGTAPRDFERAVRR